MKHSPISEALADKTIDQKLAPIIKDVLFPWLDNKSLVMFAYTCNVNASSYKDEINKRARNVLLELVVKGKEEKAKQIIQSKPEFLCNNKASVIDYSGCTIKGLTPFQAALCAGDVEMCEMMKEVGFSRLENGQEKLKKQFDEIFPRGIDKHIEEQEKNVFDFGAILQAIKNAPIAEVNAALDKRFDADLALIHALSEFRTQFKEKILGERVYNPYHLLETLKIYDDEFDNLGEYKRDLFLCQVKGYTQRLATAPNLQALAQGVCNIVERNDPLSRSFNFRCGGDSILPRARDDFSGVGFDFDVNESGGTGLTVGEALGGESRAPQLAFFVSYFKQKYQELSEITRPQQKVCRSCGVCK